MSLLFIFLSALISHAGNSLVDANEPLLEAPKPLNTWSTDGLRWTGNRLLGPTIGNTPLRLVRSPFSSVSVEVPLEVEEMAPLAERAFQNHNLNADDIRIGAVILKQTFPTGQFTFYKDLGPSIRKIFRQPRDLSAVKAIFANLVHFTLDHGYGWSTHTLIESLDYDLYYLEGLRWDEATGLRTDRLKATKQTHYGPYVFAELMGAVVRYDSRTKQIVFLSAPLIFCHGYEGVGAAHFELWPRPKSSALLVIRQPRNYGAEMWDVLGIEQTRFAYRFGITKYEDSPRPQFIYDLLDEQLTRVLGKTGEWLSLAEAEAKLRALVLNNLDSDWTFSCKDRLGIRLQKDPYSSR